MLVADWLSLVGIAAGSFVSSFVRLYSLDAVLAPAVSLHRLGHHNIGVADVANVVDVGGVVDVNGGVAAAADHNRSLAAGCSHAGAASVHTHTQAAGGDAVVRNSVVVVTHIVAARPVADYCGTQTCHRILVHAPPDTPASTVVPVVPAFVLHKPAQTLSLLPERFLQNGI